MRKKYGFTLIELLAVIVVLAIIALIATPVVFGIINTAKKGAAEQSTIAYAKAVENSVIEGAMKNKEYADRDDYVYDEIEVSMNGTVPNGGIYALKNGIVTNGTFCVDGYEVTYSDSKAEAHGKCNGDELKLNGSIKLSQTSGFYTYPGSKEIDVIENISGGKLSCTSSDEKVATCSISGTTLKILFGSKKDNATITIKSEGNSKYKDAYAAYLVIKKGLISYTATGYEGTYDGSPHGITVSASEFTIKYGEKEGVYNLDESPKYTDAGTHRVYYEITKTGYEDIHGSKDVIISKANGNFKLESVTGKMMYDDTKRVEISENVSGGALSATIKDSNIADVSIENNNLIIKGKSVGTATITVKVDETTNYNAYSADYIITINKANNTLKLSSNSETYTYPNSGTFEVSENKSGGVLSCSTDDSNIATCSITGNVVTVVPGTKEGTATITVKSESTANYNEETVTHVAKTLKGTLSSYTATGYEGTYNGNAHGITVTSSGATISYSTDGTNYSSTNPTYTLSGIYTVYYKIEKAGYGTITGNKQVIIIPPTPTITASDSIGSGSWHKNKYTLTFNVSGSSSSVYYYYGIASSNPSIKGSSVEVSSNTNGTPYYVKACVSDLKCSAVSSYMAKVDSTSPTAPKLSATLGNTTTAYTGSWTKENVKITGSSSDSGSGITKIEYSTDKNTWKNDWGTLSKSGNSASISGTWTSNYNTTIYARATDAAGNVSAISSIALKIDKTGPSFGTVSLNPNLTSWTNRCGGKIKVNWNLTDSGSGIKASSGHPYLTWSYYSVKSRKTLKDPTSAYDTDATTSGNTYGGGGILRVCGYDNVGNSTCIEKTLYQYCSTDSTWNLTYVSS